MYGPETLRDHNFTPNSSIDLTIKLVTEMIQFSVRDLDGSSITMFDSIDTTGGQLKARLEVKTGILAAQQILTYTKEIQDSTTLREISLPDKGTIHMSLRLTGGMVKENTSKQFGCDSTYIHSPGTPVPRTPQGYGSNLPPTPPPRTPTSTQPQETDPETLQFFVQTFNGNSLTMRESHDTTGGQLKARLQVRTGIPAAQMRLTYTKNIQDLATLREISLQKNGTIRISLHLLGGMENAAATRQIRCDSIYVRSLGISLTHTPQGYEITGIAPDSPADREERMSRGLFLLKIGNSFDNLLDLNSAEKALNGISNTPVMLQSKQITTNGPPKYASCVSKTTPRAQRQMLMEEAQGRPRTLQDRSTSGSPNLQMTPAHHLETQPSSERKHHNRPQWTKPSLDHSSIA
jgi:hypothetical protein